MVFLFISRLILIQNILLGDRYICIFDLLSAVFNRAEGEDLQSAL